MRKLTPLNLFPLRTLVAALVSTVSWAIVLSPAPVLAQGERGPNQKPFQEIGLDLTEGVVSKILPFDVPFVLTGEVPNTVTLVRAYLDRPRPVSPATTVKDPARRTTCDGIVWNETNEISTWSAPPAGALPTQVNPPTRTFRLLYPALEVNTNYCIRFSLERAVTTAEANAFQTRAVAAIDQEIRALSFQDRNLDNDNVEALRQRLIAAIRDQNSEIRAVNGTLFDPRPPEMMSPEDLIAAQRDLLTRTRRARQAQFQLVEPLNSYRKLAPPARAAANALKNNAFLRTSEILSKQLTSADLAVLNRFVSGPDFPVDALPIAPDDIRATRTGDACTVPQIANLNLFDVAIALERASTVLKNNALFPGDATQRNASTTLVDNTVNALAGLLQAANEVARLLCDRAIAIDEAAVNLRSVARAEVSLLVTTTGNFATRHAWYFSVDVGLAIAPVIGEIFPYVGVNMYFRPVNKDARLSSLRNTFSRRFSMMIGYTWTDNLLKDDERLGLFNRDEALGVTVAEKPADAMMVFGAGLRLTDALRLAGGALVFKGADPNPLITDTTLQVTPFISFSWDWDAIGDVKGLGGLMGFGNTPIPVKVGSLEAPPPAPPPTPPAEPVNP